MSIDKKDYPHLFQEQVWPWRDTPWRAVFENDPGDAMRMVDGNEYT